jgi:hypothetical protein
MNRWMLSTAIVALFGAMAVADDRTSAKPAKVIRVLVLEDAQPLPAGPSSAPTVVPGVIVDESAIAGASTACHSDTQKKKHLAKLFKKEDCEGCGSLRYYSWFAWSSCRSFFNEGPYAPRYPGKCPGCCPHH